MNDETYTSSSFTFLDEGVEIKATLNSNKLLYISGFIEGKAETSNKIIVTSTGRVKGNLIAPSIEIYGAINGEIYAEENILIRSTATIKGNIYGKSISIEDGANIDGRVRTGISAETGTSVKNNEDTPSNEPKKIPKEPEYKPAPNRFVADMLIHLQGEGIDEKFIESIQKAGIEFMNALKFSLEIFDEPTLNPFFQKLTFVRKGLETPETVADDYKKGSSILEEAFIKRKNDSNNLKLLKASDNLAAIIDQAETLTIVLGKIIIVKYTDGNVQSLAVELISDELNKILKNNPQFICQTSKIYSKVTE